MNAPHRPRIGVDFHTYDGKFQGSRSHLLGLYQAAIPMAPDLDFVFLLAEPDRLRREHPVFAEPNVRLVEMATADAAVRLGWQLPRAQRRERLDLLHMQYRLPLVPAGPVACTVHDVLFESHPQFFPGLSGQLLRRTGRRAAREAALLFAVSAYTRDEMARRYGIDPARVAITGNGVDLQRFRPGPEGSAFVRSRGLEPGGYLLTVGRIEARKNHLNLLKAMALCPRPRRPLVVVGHGEAEAEPIYRAARELKLGDDVIFLDDVGDRELPALLRHAAVFVYPSFAEGFGMPVLEAMASEVAVVTSATTALREVAADAALTVDPEQPAEIAAAMLALLADPVHRLRLARRGREHAGGYQWTAPAQTLVERFREHLSTTGRGARSTRPVWRPTLTPSGSLER